MCAEFVKKKKKKGEANEMEESFEMDIEFYTRKKTLKKQKPLYEGIECRTAVYLFS